MTAPSLRSPAAAQIVPSGPAATDVVFRAPESWAVASVPTSLAVSVAPDKVASVNPVMLPAAMLLSTPTMASPT